MEQHHYVLDVGFFILIIWTSEPWQVDPTMKHLYQCFCSKGDFDSADWKNKWNGNPFPFYINRDVEEL